MRRMRIWVCCAVLSGVALAGNGAWAASDSPEALAAARQEAMGLIQRGQRLEAAQFLLENLRAIPKDRADLAYPAIGTVQLLMFDHEYLMNSAERENLYGTSLDETKSTMDLFLATLMRYLDDTGISQAEATRCAVDLFKLTRCDNLPVRIGALFIMSNPYYFYETPMAYQARDRIAQQFPGTVMAEEAQRLVLYTARKQRGEGLRKVLEAKTDEGALRSDSRRLQEGPVGQALYAALRSAALDQGDAACVAGLSQVAAQADDWTEEYAALNVLAGFLGTGTSPQVRAATTAAIVRNNDPRTVYRARILRLSIAGGAGDIGTLLEDADALLNTATIPCVPDRNNYEELKNNIQRAAERLVELGQIEAARGLYQRLADRFPSTVLSAQLEQKIATLPTTATTAP